MQVSRSVCMYNVCMYTCMHACNVDVNGDDVEAVYVLCVCMYVCMYVCIVHA